MATNINLDDSDDDLDLPPTTNNGGGQQQHKDPISLDTDSEEDDLPPATTNNFNTSTTATAGARGGVSLDDSDDDLPPASPTGGAKVAPTSTPTTNSNNAAANTTSAPPAANGSNATSKQPGAVPKSVSINAPAASLPPSSPGASNLDATTRARAGTLKRRTISDAAMEGFLFKQSPTWPYVMQKRWVTLKGRVLSYYEEKTSTAPSGTIDLKGAQIIDSPQNAKAPHALGISGDTPSLKGRTFYFSAASREEYLGWLEILKFVTTEPKNSEIHWFEKMAQGLY